MNFSTNLRNVYSLFHRIFKNLNQCKYFINVDIISCQCYVQEIEQSAEQEDKTMQLVEEVAQRLQSGLNVIDTIIEEEEPSDTPPDSLHHGEAHDEMDALSAALNDAITARQEN